jgi:hypothetical protein
MSMMMPVINFKQRTYQGDPLYPRLFSIVVDMLVVIVGCAKFDGQIDRAVPHHVDEG